MLGGRKPPDNLSWFGLLLCPPPGLFSLGWHLHGRGGGVGGIYLSDIVTSPAGILWAGSLHLIKHFWGRTTLVLQSLRVTPPPFSAMRETHNNGEWRVFMATPGPLLGLIHTTLPILTAPACSILGWFVLQDLLLFRALPWRERDMSHLCFQPSVFIFPQT